MLPFAYVSNGVAGWLLRRHSDRAHNGTANSAISRKGIVMAAHLFTAALVAVLYGSSNATTVQAPPSGSGHWEGAIQIPAQELKIQIDLQGTGEKWEGTIAIPAQGLKGFPLSAITVQGEAVTFAM